MEGSFQESGPLWTAPGGQTLQKNDYSFNRFAHTMYLEAPACVGFSTADRLIGCTHNDNSTAADNLAALQVFYTLFPELATAPLWLNGESYAGLYIPMLAFNIYNYNLGSPAVPLPLKGILVGNGCIGSDAGVCGSSPYGDYLSLSQFHGHAFLSDKAYEAANAACGDYSQESPACRAAVDAATNEVGNNFDVYDLYSGMWNVCDYGNRLRKLGRPVAPGSFLGRLLARQAALLRDNNCTSDDDLTTYLNLPSVQAALHVTPKTWQECGGIVYTSEMKDERAKIYPTLIEKAQINVFIFNGQADACVPVTDNQWWTRSMGYPEKAGWAPWSASDGSNGGYVTEYSVPGSGSFTFATVRGSGHSECGLGEGPAPTTAHTHSAPLHTLSYSLHPLHPTLYTCSGASDAANVCL
jgi:hypothetical protein